jgi:hypothetical protein
MPSIPTRSSMARTLRQAAADYLTFAETYASEYDIEKVRHVFALHRDIFRKDHLDDWIELTLNHLPKHIIRRLARIYQVLDLKELARYVGWNDLTVVQRELMKFIDQKAISAVINMECQVIMFTDDQEIVGHYTKDIETLKRQLHHIMNRTRCLRDQVHTHPTYVEKMKMIQIERSSHQELSEEDDINMEVH